MEKVHLGVNVSINPMPVTLIGANVNGKPNFMTAAWVNMANYKPPMIAMALSKEHYTNEGICENKTFSVNFPGADLFEETDYCGLVSGSKIDKSKVFKVFYGKAKTAPMIIKCPVTIECTLVDIYSDLPTNDIFIGEIVAAFSEEKYLTDGKIDYTKTNPLLLTMPDNNYWKLGEYVGKAWHSGMKLRDELR